MTINKDRNKDRFENWQLCGAWKLPVLWPRSSLFQATLESSLFYGHGVIKLTQNQSLNQSPGAPPSFTRKYHPCVLECIHLLQCIAAHLPHALPWAYTASTSVYLAGLRKTLFCFFKQKQGFVFSLQKHKKHSEWFLFHHAIMQYHYFQNYTIITCTYYGIQNWG